MKLASQFVLRIIASLVILYGLAILNVAAAHGPPTFRINCDGAEYGVDQVICANVALKVAYNKLTLAYDQVREFTFVSSADRGVPAISAISRNVRRYWGTECGIAAKPNPGRIVASQENFDCLSTLIGAEHINVRCPLFFNTGGPDSEREQEAWLKRNIEFCERETGIDFRLSK